MTPSDFASLLDRLGLSRPEAARLLGVTPAAVRHWCNGRSRITGPAERLVWLMEMVPEARHALVYLADDIAWEAAGRGEE